MQSHRGNGSKRLVAEINVTPLVDVMLVLLIIFMITAPMMTQGVNVELPKTTTKTIRQEEDPLIVSIDKEGKISLGKINMTSVEYLKQQLEKSSVDKKKEPILLRADKNVAYGTVVEVVASIKEAGFEKLGMITQPEDGK